MVTVIVTQAVVVFVLMFSPLTFLPEKLPEWMAVLHRILPIQAMGEVIRGSLATTTFPLHPGTFLLLGAWCAGSLAAAFLALNRRG